MPTRPVPLKQFGILGMRDSRDSTTHDRRRALLLENVYPLDPLMGTRLVGRPGFTVMGAQLGAVGARRGQWVGQFTKKNGTELTVAIVGGRLYTFNWGTRVWTEVPLVGVTLSTSARVGAVVFNDQLIISDGVNTPFAWDGASTFTLLSACPVLYGPPTVYYGKLFGIKATDRLAFVWSEENDATTGYESGGLNNAWTFSQTGSERLTRLVGTNEALYVFRESAIAAVQGEVTPDFRSDGTREGISENVGTLSPWSVQVRGRIVYFLDQHARMHKIEGGLVELWEDSRETVDPFPKDQLEEVASAIWHHVQQVVWACVSSGTGDPDKFLTLHGPTNGFAGVWTGFPVTQLGVVKNAAGEKLLVHLSADGFAYEHGAPEGTLWDDALVAGTVAILHRVHGAPLGFDANVDKVFDLVDLVFRSETVMNDVEFSYDTPRGGLAAQVFDVALGLGENKERHVAVGLDAQGRWMIPKIRHQQLGERFGILGWNVEMYPTAIEATIP